MPSPLQRDLGAEPAVLEGLAADGDPIARRAGEVVAEVARATAAQHPTTAAMWSANGAHPLGAAMREAGHAGGDGGPRSMATVAVVHLFPEDGHRPQLLDRVAAALPLAPPLPVLLASGGDDRQTIDPALGENRYGTATYPRPEMLAYSSCTASDPSPAGFGAADALRLELLRAALAGGDGTDGLRRVWEDVRHEVTGHLVGGDPTDVVFVPTPSGTDAETLALAVSLGRDEQVTVVVVAPGEVGSGTVAAATGRSFSEATPNGGRRVPGAELPGRERQVRSVLVEVRDDRGRVRPPGAVEQEVLAAVEDGVGRGHQVLLHLVEGSKTGLRVPRRGFVRSIQQRFAHQVDVLVDAAQLRIATSELRDHLDDGAMVLVTGSKFVGGPPFSGGLLLSEQHRQRLAGGSAIDLTDYLDAVSLPPSLAHLAAPDHPPNVGLLLRWAAARAELARYRAVAPPVRRAITDELCGAVRRALARCPAVEDVTDRRAAGPQTIASFRLGQGRGRDLGFAKAVHGALRRADSGASSGAWEGSSRPGVHLGQPVQLGEGGAGGVALRLAISAQHVADIAAVPEPDRAAALAREGARLDAVFRQLTDTTTFLAGRADAPAGAGS